LVFNDNYYLLVLLISAKDLISGQFLVFYDLIQGRIVGCCLIQSTIRSMIAVLLAHAGFLSC